MAHKCFSNHTNHTRPRAITTRRVTLALCHQQSLFHTEQIGKIRAHGLRPKNNSPIYHMLKRDSARSQLGVFTSALKMEPETKDGPPEGCLGYPWTWSKCPGIPGPCRWPFRQPCCKVATRQPDQEQVWSQHLLIQKHLMWFLLNGLNRWHHWRNHHTVSLLLRVSQNGLSS